jgi:hypothetical protein
LLAATLNHLPQGPTTLYWFPTFSHPPFLFFLFLRGILLLLMNHFLPSMTELFTCPVGQRKCADKIQCILDKYRCDGTNQCNDLSDEENCREYFPLSFFCFAFPCPYLPCFFLPFHKSLKKDFHFFYNS